MKYKIVMVIFAVVILVVVLFPKTEEAEYYEGQKEEINLVEVTILGAINFPGTYYFYEPITVEQIIDQAGGALPNANLKNISLSKVISTTYNITILSDDIKQEVINQLININEASFAELLTIPYMTETKAANLILYREANGAFSSVDDLVHVKYIGTATLEKIKPYITV